MYTVRWRDYEGSQQERLFEERRDAYADARGLRKLGFDVDVTGEKGERFKPKMPAFLREALETGRTVTVIYSDYSQSEGVIIDVDTNLRAITLDSEYGERLVFMSAISTII